MAQPLRLVGEQPERGSMRLREAEAGEADELVVDEVGDLLVDAVANGTLDEPHPVGLERGTAALAAHRAPQALCLSHREARERDRHVEHLVLEDDDAERRAERLAQRLVVDRVDERGILAQPPPVLDVRDAPPCPGSGPGRTSATCTVRSSIVSGFVRSRLCIWARLSIWKVPTVSARWISANTSRSSSGIRERSIGAP